MPIITDEECIHNGRMRQIGASIRITKRKQSRHAVFLCDCGNKVLASRNKVKSGHTRSCGCLKREMIAERSITHGRTRDRKFPRTYMAWAAMKRRCTNKKAKQWGDYGGRGITFDARWNEYQAFEDDMGFVPDGMSLDRIDNNGNYGPNNCRWATSSEQMSNTRKTRLLTFGGKTMCLAAWERELGFSKCVIRTRINCGWTVEEICTTPCVKRHRSVSGDN